MQMGEGEEQGQGWEVVVGGEDGGNNDFSSLSLSEYETSREKP